MRKTHYSISMQIPEYLDEDEDDDKIDDKLIPFMTRLYGLEAIYLLNPYNDEEVPHEG